MNTIKDITLAIAIGIAFALIMFFGVMK